VDFSAVGAAAPLPASVMLSVRLVNPLGNWRFWEMLIGEVDIQHRLRLRAAIDGEIRKSPECEQEIRIGYERSKAAWDDFWTNIFEAETEAALAA